MTDGVKRCFLRRGEYSHNCPSASSNHSPSAVSTSLPVAPDLDGVLPLGAPARVGVLALLDGRRLLAGRRREEVVCQPLQSVRGRALPVRDGAGHGGVDAAARDDRKPQVIALVS